MKFFVPAFIFAATAMALPGSGSAAGVAPQSNNEVEDAVNKCGNGAKMSCCNKINKSEGISQNNIGASPTSSVPLVARVSALARVALSLTSPSLVSGLSTPLN
jgi:Fungal hydrophobin.